MTGPPDKPIKLGAASSGKGVWFRVRSRSAEALYVCFFDAAGTEARRLPLKQGSDGVWQRYVPNVPNGQLYGFRAAGPFDPDRGLHFNLNKLLLDPYARAVSGRMIWDPAVFAFERGAADQPDDRDSAPFVPKSVVVDDAFDWQGDRALRIPLERTLIYECHVRGMTKRHPQVPGRSRGKYLGLAHSAVLDHLRGLGVTAIQLMPVQHFISEEELIRTGRTNHWGYNPIALFAPHSGYATNESGGQVTEFKTLVKALHAAGFEVILDVVLNHTAEGDHTGPSLSFRGLDNPSYYRLDPTDLRRYQNYSGCGNTLDLSKHDAGELALDCLRYWVDEMHVDGFRFDLGVVLGRSARGFEASADLLRRIENDETLSQVKLIVEPWDLGPNGYQLGRFGPRWAEWNDRYRDDVRGFWLDERTGAGLMATRLAGSSDLFDHNGRFAASSINYVSCHDGRTAADLVSKRFEGSSEDAERVRRSLLVTLALSHGTPMLAMGDELGRSQGGNPNAYDDDSLRTWVDWEDSSGPIPELSRILSEALSLRRTCPPLSISSFWTNRDVQWVNPRGGEMTLEDWRNGDRGANRVFGMLLAGPEGASRLLLLFNPDRRGHLFKLPRLDRGERWHKRFDTGGPVRGPVRYLRVRLHRHSILVLSSTSARRSSVLRPDA